jgi:hypothetical protein
MIRNREKVDLLCELQRSRPAPAPPTHNPSVSGGLQPKRQRGGPFVWNMLWLCSFGSFLNPHSHSIDATIIPRSRGSESSAGRALSSVKVMTSGLNRMVKI